MSELWHYGKKGMKWGVVNEDPTSGSPGGTSSGTVARTTGGGAVAVKTNNHALAKKVAIGAGVTAAVAGGAFVAYKLNKSGAIKMKDLDLTDPTGLELRPDFAESRKKLLNEVSLLDKTRAVTEKTTRKGFEKELFDKTPTINDLTNPDSDQAMKIFDEFMKDPSKNLKLGTAGKGSSRFQQSVDDKLADIQVQGGTKLLQRLIRDDDKQKIGTAGRGSGRYGGRGR